jgi:hypothetical protein
MTIPALFPPTRVYYDPSLWDRLAPAIREHQAEIAQHILDGRWKSLEEAREKIGYLRALDWLFKKADDLTRIENETPKE